MTAQTKQATFDTVAKHLLAQGGPSMLTEEQRKEIEGSAHGLAITCAYRGMEGRKCAAGALIPDDQYDLRMEGEGIAAHTRVGAVLLTLGHDPALVSALQRVHDDLAASEEHWKLLSQRLRVVAENNNLSTGALA